MELEKNDPVSPDTVVAFFRSIAANIKCFLYFWLVLHRLLSIKFCDLVTVVIFSDYVFVYISRWLSSLSDSPGVDGLHHLHKDQIILEQTDHFKLNETKLGWIEPESDQSRTEQTRLIQIISGSSRRPVPVSNPGKWRSTVLCASGSTRISENWSIPLILCISLIHVSSTRENQQIASTLLIVSF